MAFASSGGSPPTVNTQILKLAGQSVSGVVVGNWQAAETNLITLGANDTRYKVHALNVQILGLVGVITIRMYTQVNGVERQIFPDPLLTTFTVALDGPAISVINGTFGISEALRVTIQSTAVADNGVALAYDATIEAM
jgi:hypothetical protein